MQQGKTYTVRETENWWRNHLNLVEGPPKVDKSFALDVARLGNIGVAQGQIRPGWLGKYDMYFTLLYGGVQRQHALNLSGLSAGEMAETEREEHLRDMGVDVDDREAVADYESIEQMTTAERDEAITWLQQHLCPESKTKRRGGIS